MTEEDTLGDGATKQVLVPTWLAMQELAARTQALQHTTYRAHAWQAGHALALASNILSITDMAAWLARSPSICYWTGQVESKSKSKSRSD